MRYFFLLMPALSIVVALAPLAKSPRQNPIQNSDRASYHHIQRRYAQHYQQQYRQRARYERLRYERMAMAKRQGKIK